jgi:WD40 repeat protein
VELVVRQDVRPERPDEEDAPQLSDVIWGLAEKCWVKEAKDRPTASAVCDILCHLLDTAVIAQAAASPSSHLIAQASPLHPPSLAPNLTLQGHTDWVVCATFSPDGKYIVSGSDDCTICVWDAQTGNLALGPLEKHTSYVTCVAFSPNGRQIASGSGDNTVLVWHAVTGTVLVGPFKGHTSGIWSVSFSPDGSKIVSGSYDHTIRVWDAQTGVNITGPLKGHTDGVNSVVFSGDGKQIASGSDDKTIRVWNTESGRLIQGPLRGHNNWVEFVAFSPDGKRIVSVDWGGDVCVCNMDTGACVSGPSKRHAAGALAVGFIPGSTWTVAVSPDGKWIAGRSKERHSTVQVWDLKTGLLVATFEEHTNYVYSISFSPDSKRILSTSEDKTIRVHTLNC